MLRCLLSLCLLLGLLACSKPPTASVSEISLTPQAQKIASGGSLTLSATLSGSGNFSKKVQWTVVSGGGAIQSTSDTTASYTAAVVSDITTVSIKATSVQDPKLSKTLQITVEPAISDISVSSTSQSLLSGAQTSLSASVVGSGSFNSQVSWSIVSGGGTLASPSSNTTVYTAPSVSSNTTVTVKATSVGRPSLSKTLELSVQPPTQTNLLISEVGSSYYTNSICWLEVYNGTASALNLSDYALRVRSISTDGATSEGRVSFSLPTLVVQPGHYAVIGGKVNASVFATNRSVYVSHSPNFVPYWYGAGSIELLQNSQTVDFVRFGSNSDAPQTASGWTGSSAPALPTEYGHALVRSSLLSDNNSATDWSLRSFVTPAGPNDVSAGASDTDQDGLPDSAEVAGGTLGGLDLYAMGARVGPRDIFIEVDHMNSSDPGIVPASEALDRVKAAFAAHNIALHFDVGNLFSSGFNPSLHNLGNATAQVPYSAKVVLGEQAGFSNLYQIKASSMDFARSTIFHYMLFGSSQEADGSAGSSGYAEINGNDLMVTLGNWGLSRSSAQNNNALINIQAATIMHELGHNLGLHHGGNEETNYKPNYLSVMNYLYNIPGLSQPSGSTAADRYYFFRRTKGILYWSHLENSPFSSSYILDYSDGSSTPLNENTLNENAGLGRGAAVVDYDNNNLTSSSTAFDINSDSQMTTLNDHNDWANLNLPFQRMFQTYTQSQALHQPSRLVPVSDDIQPSIAEEAPDPALLEELRRRK